MSTIITHSITSSVKNQGLFFLNEAEARKVGLWKCSDLKVNLPNGRAVTTEWTLQIRIGKDRMQIAKALKHLEYGDKYDLIFEGPNEITITPHQVKAKASIRNYDHPEKNRSRKTIWLEMRKKLTVDPKKSLVLYLAGHADLDRIEAKALGFLDSNLVAVERDPKICAKLKSEGKLVINGELSAVLSIWRSKPVHAIYADLSCGCTPETKSIMFPLVRNQAFNNCALAINLLRGRDGVTSENNDRRSRALMAWDVFNNALAHELVNSCANTSQNTAQTLTNTFSKPPSFYQYKSSYGHQVFDYAVWRIVTASAVADKAGIALKVTTSRPVNSRVIGNQMALSRQIAAVMAHHSRRV